MPKYHEAYGEVCQGPFGFPMLEKQARELDKLLDTDPDYEYFKLGNHDGRSDYFIEGERADVSVITDESIDRDGEILELKTANFKPLEETRLVSFNHNYNIPPIAKNIWIKNTGTKVLAKSVFPSKPKDFPSEKEFFPDTIFHLIKEKFLPGKSVGGVAKRFKPTSEEIAANPLLKDVKNIRRNAQVFEYAVVTLNSNKNAIVEAVSKGYIRSGEELIHEFPELINLKKDNEPLIKSYTSEEDYRKGMKTAIAAELGNFLEQLPKSIDDTFARMLGKV